MVHLALLLALAAAAVVAGALRPRLAAWAAALAALGSAGVLGAAWAGGVGVMVDLPWLPSLGTRFLLALDPLAAPLSVFVTAIAVPVFLYTAAYLPRYLAKEGRDPRAAVTFAALMLGFMLAMVLLILAQDLLVIFLALEATAIASFLLIRFDSRKVQARRAALVALLVTAGSSLLFLLGVVMVAIQAESTALSALRTGEAGQVSMVAALCLVFGVIGKSAQVPLHFWLPRAMVAPTPVSAYLHSAALVAAGVFVLQRLYFLLEATPPLLDLLFWFAFLSIAVGAVMALVSDELKRILAYSTVAQYGYAVALVAAGGSYGALGAPFFLLAHGLAKCALFMTAGAITTTTGAHRLAECGGLWRPMPLLAAGSGLAAAGLAGLPLTIGYFKDELLIKAAIAHGSLGGLFAAGAIALTVAYTARFWFGIFAGPGREAPRVAPGLSWPVAGLAALVVLAGIWPAPLEPPFVAAGQWIAGTLPEAALKYDTTWGPALWLTLAGWAGGAAVAVFGGRLARLLRRPVARTAAWIGPAAWASRIARAGTALSGALYRLELRDMRDRLTIVLVPTAAFALLGVIPHQDWPRLVMPAARDLPLAGTLLLVAGAALVVARPLNHLSFVLLVSFVGFSLALAFALTHAPDVVLVLVLIETAFTLLFLAVLARFRVRVLRKARGRMHNDRGPVAGIAAGVVAAGVAWLALSVPRPESLPVAHVVMSEQAHAKDVVTAILADFRGLDTAGELTVLVVAMFGAVAIVWGRST